MWRSSVHPCCASQVRSGGFAAMNSCIVFRSAFEIQVNSGPSKAKSMSAKPYFLPRPRF